MKVFNVLATSHVLLILFVSAVLASEPTAYDASQFLATFKDGYFGTITFIDEKVCRLYKRTSLTNHNTMAQYSVMSRKQGETNLNTNTISFKVVSRSIMLETIYENNEVRQQNLTLVYARYGKCVVFQFEATRANCVSVVYTNATKRDVDGCAQHFPSSCSDMRFPNLVPSECKNGN
ncbi:uncharacterized protein ISCGN_031639 [Ixodes scapularis]